ISRANAAGRIFSGFFFGANEHGVCVITANHFGAPAARQRDGQIACAAAEIEDARFGALKNILKTRDDAAAPNPIHVTGKEMVQEIVARRNTAEHFADARGSLSFSASAFGLRACCGMFGVRWRRDGHYTLVPVRPAWADRNSSFHTTATI